MEPEKASAKQIQRIAYELQSAEVEYREGMNTALESLDKGTASDLIGMFLKGNRDLAIKQLAHLFPTLF